MKVGIDAALNHGAVVDETGTVLFQWKTGAGLRSTETDLWEKAVDTIRVLKRGDDVRVDWDSRIGAWGRPKVAVLVTLYVGMVFAGARAKGCSIRLVRPSEVRKHYGLPARAHKKEVWEKAGIEEHGFKHEDVADAWILTRVE